MPSRFSAVYRSVVGRLRSYAARTGEGSEASEILNNREIGSPVLPARADAFSERQKTSWEELGKVSFHFFEESDLVAIRRRLRGIAITHEALTVTTIPKGIIATPFVKNGISTVGVFDARCRLIEQSVRVGGKPRDVPHEPSRRELKSATADPRTAAYFGVSSTHFGHFLLETLSRAWASFQLDEESVPVVLARERLAPFATAFFEVLPRFAERVLILERTTRFANVLLPSPAFVIRRSANVQFKAFCIEIANRVLPGHATSSQPVYLSRSALGPGTHRAIVGEERLERLLEKEGFLIVNPERLSIPEQIAIINRHSWILAPMGSACHTRLFSRMPTNLVMLARPHVSPNYVLCDSLSEGSTHYADVFCIPNSGYGEPTPWQPLLLDEGKLLNLLKQLGLVRPGAAFEGPPPDAETYKMRWLSVAKREAARSPSGELDRIIRTLE